MFIRNPTSLDVNLARGHISEELAVASVVVDLPMSVDGERLVPPGEPLRPSDTDPPKEVAKAPLWQGVSVTAAGHAFGPPAAPYVCPVILRVGNAERRLIVFGERRWERDGVELFTRHHRDIDGDHGDIDCDHRSVLQWDRGLDGDAEGERRTVYGEWGLPARP